MLSFTNKHGANEVFPLQTQPLSNLLIGQKVHRTQTESMHVLFQLRFCWGWCTVAETNSSPLKRMVGRWIFFWEGLFSGALLNLGRVNSPIFVGTLSFPPTLLVNECGNGCPPQQELKQISNFQPAVFVFYTNINPVSLPLILPCGVPRLSWCQPWWGISKVWLEESQLHPVIIRYIYMKLIHCIPVPLSSSI